MKNLLIYTNPDKVFSEENKTLVKIQIDNSLDLGWKREDILLFTNFNYEYNGVKAIIIDEWHRPYVGLPKKEYIDIRWDRTSNKIFVIRLLMLNRVLEEGELYWYHDFDAYQNEVITREELGLNAEVPIGLTGYGYKKQINGGSFFFINNSEAREMFEQWCKQTLEIRRTRADEKTMTDMTMLPIKFDNKLVQVNGGIAWIDHHGALTYAGYELLNLTYNYGQRCPQLCHRQATQPLKVLHFHPQYKFYPKDDTNINVFMYGHNKYKIPLMSDRLVKIFKQHGY